MNNLKDLSYMEMSYALAARARGSASPNPYVGAVVVREDRVVGWGYHEKPGRPHAEIIALRRAGSLAKGGTLYVTLEPCVHWGRTPPCIDTVLRAGLRRVVISSLDPNPIVYKKGVRALRRAGIEVAVGILAEKNARLNEAYIKFITRNLPFVVVKSAVSLDGRLATGTFDSRWISSAAARDYAHLLRGECDALLVGINTVLRDNPLLTVRHPTWGKKKIVRVVLDSGLRFPLRARLLSTLERGSLLIFAAAGSPAGKKEALGRKGAEVIEVGRSARGLDLGEVLSKLAERGITSLLVEGGSQAITSFLEGRHADKAVLIVAPRLIGGERAPSFFEGRGFKRVEESLGLRRVLTFGIGPDFVIEGYF